MQFPYVEKKATPWQRRNQLDSLEKDATPRHFKQPFLYASPNIFSQNNPMTT